MTLEPLHLDVETQSAANLKQAGAHRYAEDPSTRIVLASYRFGSGPMKRWVGEDVPQEVFNHIANRGPIVGHNQQFERVILNARLNAGVSPVQQDCTMARALAMGLPASLDGVGEILNLAIQKDKDGHALMMRMCKAGYQPKPGEMDRLAQYCDTDVETECGVDAALPQLSPRERQVWILDQTINDRGFRIDLQRVMTAQGAVEEAKRRADRDIWRATNGAVGTVNQVAKLVDWLNSRGIPATSVADASLDDIICGAELLDDAAAIEAVGIRRAAAGAFKFEAMARAVCADGRVRGCLQYHGTHGGRWAGRVVQPHNFKRQDSEEDQARAAMAVDLMGRYTDPVEFLDALSLYDDKPLEALTLCARPMIIADRGKRLFNADFSNIEGRLNAWFAGERWKIRAFEEFDRGEGPDLYKVTASRVLDKPIDAIAKEERQNQGKVPELACIAEGELVLTDQGLVPIERVTLDMLVWDGVEFVSHEGIVFRGERDVITYDGLTATRDHRVWVDGQHWPVQFGDAAARGQRLVRSGAGRAPVRVGVDHQPREALRDGLARRVRAVRMPGLQAAGLGVLGQPHARTQQRLSAVFAGGEAVCPSAQVAGEALFGSAPALPQHTIQAVRRVWRSGDHLRLSDRPGHGVVGSREPGPAKRHGIGSHQQRPGLQAGEPSVVDQTRQHEEQSRCKTAKTYDIRNTGPRNRFTASGRLVHNCGYQGGYRAFLKMAAKYGATIPVARASQIVADWREANPLIVQSWDDLGRAAIEAVDNPGCMITVLGDKVRYLKPADQDFLFCCLPSGRVISYAKPKLGWSTRYFTPDGKMVSPDDVAEMSRDERGALDESRTYGISFRGAKNGRTIWIDLYGGMQCAHVVSGTARDMLVEAAFAVERHGYPLVLTVHDELLSEAAGGSAKEYQQIIEASQPAWLKGLPLVCKADEGDRYSK